MKKQRSKSGRHSKGPSHRLIDRHVDKLKDRAGVLNARLNVVSQTPG